jgi:hypothetical protein
MIPVAAITDSLAVVVLALTPVQRWNAAGRFNTGFMTERWFTITLVVVIIVATILLFIVSYNRTLQEKRSNRQLFASYARKRGLSERECQVLLEIANNAKLKQSEAIFTMNSGFERGVTKMIEESAAQGQTAEETRRLKTELSFLGEKLGFQKRPLPSTELIAGPKKMRSREIPVGKKLYIKQQRAHTSEDIESTVIKNNDTELTVRLTKQVRITFGEPWQVRYYFGGSVWEFDTSVVSYDGDTLVLNHSDNIRFINRRRFLRVPVNKPAFVAHFPFSKTLPLTESKAKEGFDVRRAFGSGRRMSFDTAWSPPEFVPAVVTELAGPGLRIEVPLEVKVGDRVLVVLRLGEEEQHDLIPQPGSAARKGKAAMYRVVEDIGMVRHTKAIQNGFSIAVELAGLSDSDVNELIRATNVAALRAGTGNQNVEGSISAAEKIAEPAAVQGA